MSHVSIKGLPKMAVFQALYERAKPQGMGFIHYKPGPLPEEQAKEWMEQSTQVMRDGSTSIHFDYVEGRVMKVDIGGDMLATWGFDRDNGDGAAEGVIRALRERLGIPEEVAPVSEGGA